MLFISLALTTMGCLLWNSGWRSPLAQTTTVYTLQRCDRGRSAARVKKEPRAIILRIRRILCVSLPLQSYTTTL